MGAQIKESSDDATKALAIAKKSDDTLKQVQRILTPIDDQKIHLDFVLDCKQRPQYNDWCKKPPAQTGPSFGFGLLGVDILVFADPKTAQAFIDGQPDSFDVSYLTGGRDKRSKDQEHCGFTRRRLDSNYQSRAERIGRLDEDKT